jgi:polysaccharide biosynthesis protein PslG
MTLALWTRRRARRVLVLLVVIATALGSLGVNALRSAGASSTQGPRYHLVRSHFGLTPGSGFFLDQAHLRSGLDDMEKLGVRWIRSTIPWQNIQPEPNGPFNWKGVDQLAATLRMPQYRGHFSLIVTFEAPPGWAFAKSRVKHVDCASQPPFDLGEYAHALAALAGHLKSLAHVFEVENSPNIARRGPLHADPYTVWSTPNPCGYAKLITMTTAAVHHAQPGATVLVGGIGGTHDVPHQRMAADEFLYGLYLYHAKFDGVSYHPYSTPHLPCAPSKSICAFDPNPTMKDNYGMRNGWDRMLNARRVMVAFGDASKKIWITEFGGPTKAQRGTPKALSEGEQANLLAAGFQRASQYSWVSEICWFTYSDRGGNPQADPAGGWMGLIRANGTNKPAFSTYQRLARAAKA